jgi:hypothetical protein
MAKRFSRTALDTLDIVAEDSERCWGGLTGKKPMRSLGHMGPIEDERPSDAPKKGAAAARFPRPAVKILKDWLVVHIDNPYPTDEEKEHLKEYVTESLESYRVAARCWKSRLLRYALLMLL